MLLPGRNPVRLAKELATLDVLSGGRLLCTFVPGLPRRPEIDAAGVAGPDKARLMDEMLPLVRRLWAGEAVTHDGMAAHLDQVALSPLPVQQPLEFWTGGMVPAALRRCGRFADGWLPSACTPAEVAAARVVIDECRRRSRADHQPRALRGLRRLLVRAAHPAGGPGHRDRPGGGSTPPRWSRWASTGSDRCSRSSWRWASPSSWSVPWPLRTRGAAELETLAEGVLDLQT